MIGTSASKLVCQLGLVLVMVLCDAARPATRGDGPTTRPLSGKLVCIGASLTQGSLASKPELCYVGRLAAYAAAAHDNLEVINEGRSGWSTGAYAYNSKKLAEKLPADTTLITILLGTNDLREKGTPSKIAANAAHNLERLIKTYQARVPHARFVLMTPTSVYPQKFTKHLRDTGYDDTGPAKLVAIDAAYKALADKLKLQLIDLSGVMTVDDTPEGVHANDRGHEKIAQLVWRELNEPTAATTRSAAAGDPTATISGR